MPDYIPNESFIRDIDMAISLLKTAGCTEIYLFGSLAKGNATADSDIDIAVRGLEPEVFFTIYGQLMFNLHHRVDLVDLSLQKSFGEDLISSGELMRVA
jgi:predicted nucleotidyltransferase